MRRLQYKCALRRYNTPFVTACILYCLAAFVTHINYTAGVFDDNILLYIAKVSGQLTGCFLGFAVALLCYVLLPPNDKTTIAYEYRCEVYDYSPGNDVPVLRFSSNIPKGVLVRNEHAIGVPDTVRTPATVCVSGEYANLAMVSAEFPAEIEMLCKQSAPNRWTFRWFVEADALLQVSSVCDRLLQFCMWLSVAGLSYVMFIMDLTLNTLINRTCCALAVIFICVYSQICRWCANMLQRNRYYRVRGKIC